MNIMPPVIRGMILFLLRTEDICCHYVLPPIMQSELVRAFMEQLAVLRSTNIWRLLITRINLFQDFMLRV